MHGKIIGVPWILVSFRKLCLVDDGGNDLERGFANNLMQIDKKLLAFQPVRHQPFEISFPASHFVFVKNGAVMSPISELER